MVAAAAGEGDDGGRDRTRVERRQEGEKKGRAHARLRRTLDFFLLLFSLLLLSLACALFSQLSSFCLSLSLALTVALPNIRSKGKGISSSSSSALGSVCSLVNACVCSLYPALLLASHSLSISILLRCPSACVSVAAATAALTLLFIPTLAILCLRLQISLTFSASCPLFLSHSLLLSRSLSLPCFAIKRFAFSICRFIPPSYCLRLTSSQTRSQRFAFAIFLLACAGKCCKHAWRQSLERSQRGCPVESLERKPVAAAASCTVVACGAGCRPASASVAAFTRSYSLLPFCRSPRSSPTRAATGAEQHCSSGTGKQADSNQRRYQRRCCSFASVRTFPLVKEQASLSAAGLESRATHLTCARAVSLSSCSTIHSCAAAAAAVIARER